MWLKRFPHIAHMLLKIFFHLLSIMVFCPRCNTAEICNADFCKFLIWWHLIRTGEDLNEAIRSEYVFLYWIFFFLHSCILPVKFLPLISSFWNGQVTLTRFFHGTNPSIVHRESCFQCLSYWNWFALLCSLWTLCMKHLSLTGLLLKLKNLVQGCSFSSRFFLSLRAEDSGHHRWMQSSASTSRKLAITDSFTA